jgi:ribosomal protein S13/5S rRNA maturation endonuclease (ribonuclease M5)
MGEVVMTAGYAPEHYEIRQKPRVFDFITIEGLERLRGQTPDCFILFMTKELVDNALDKEGVKEIRVKIQKEDNALILSVSDNGRPTFNRRMLDKVLDFEKAPSSKRGLKTIRRGVLGNALQCCFGISYAMWQDGRPEYTAEVIGEKRFLIDLKPSEENIEASILEEPCENNGFTTLSFKLPIHDYESPFDVLRIIAMLNPHVTIHYEERGLSKTFKARTEKLLVRYETDINWYAPEEFENLVDEYKEMPVEKFVTLFRGVRNRSYAKEVLQVAGIESRSRLREISKEQVRKLYESLKNRVGLLNSNRLPKLGRTFLENFEGYSLVRYAVKRFIYEDENKKIPIIVEAASFRDDKGEGNIFEAINFTASFNYPFIAIPPYSRSILNTVMSKGLIVLIHVICPSIIWLDPAKGNVDIDQFVIRKKKGKKIKKEYVIYSLVKAVCRAEVDHKFDYKTLVELTNEIMSHYPKHTSFTVRQIFYRLVALHEYPNKEQSYKKLVNVLVRAREEGLVDADRIVDFSRPEYMNNSHYRSLPEKLQEDVKLFIENFDLDRWSLQPVYIECWIEKEALSRVIYPVCRKYRVNLIVARGYSSYTQIRKAVERFPENKKVVILYLGDHDSSGLHIQQKLEERFVEESYRIGRKLDIRVVRVALTQEQIRLHNLPSYQLKKKAQKSEEYERLYGDEVWELDALDPDILTKVTEDAIVNLIDWQIWNEREKEVENYRKLLSEKLPTLLEEMTY